MSATKLKQDEKQKEEQLVIEQNINADQVSLHKNVGANPHTPPNKPLPALPIKKYSSMSKDEKKAEEKAYKKVEEANTIVTAQQLNTPYMQHVLEDTKKIDGQKITQKELLERVKSGDCAHMQKLNPVLRNRAATLYMQEHPIPAQMTAEQFIESLKAKENPVSEMMNPLLRMGISVMMNSPGCSAEVKTKLKKIDELLNTEIMVATLTKKAKVSEGFEKEDVKRNQESQIFIMKTLLSCHLGKMKIRVTDGDNVKESGWPYTVANAFAHCSRVVITMPGGEDYNEKAEKRMFKHFKGDAGFYRRGSATHKLNRKKRDGSGDAVEGKIKFNPLHQFGMDVAVGGLGNNGIPDSEGHARKIKNDGSCGHMYMHVEKGNKTKNTGLLIGFESDSVGTMNQTGHVHDMFASPEFASSFGGQRCDEIGDKYGGRVADLSGINVESYTNAMFVLENGMKALYESNTTGSAEKIEKISRMLSGTVMGDKEMKELFKELYGAMGMQEHLDTLSGSLCSSLGYK